MKLSAPLTDEVPPAVVTVTSTGPVPGGDVAVHEVLDVQVTGVPVVPKVAVVPPTTKAVPVNVMEVPPASGPLSGLSRATVGVDS